MKHSRKRVILINAIGFILARAAFAGMNPLGIGYFTAVYMKRAGGGLAMAAVFFGMATAMPLMQVLKYLLTMIITTIVMELPLVKNRGTTSPLLYLLPALIQGLLSFMEAAAAGSMNTMGIRALLEAVIIYVAARLFASAIDFMMGSIKSCKMNNEQMVSMAVIAALAIYAVPEIPGGYIALAQTVVYFIVLYFTYKYGVGQGAITGAVCGFALSLRNDPAAFSMADVSILTMMGIVPAAFREMGRLVTAVVYLIMAGAVGVIYDGTKLSTIQIGALASATLVFLLLPNNLIYRVDAAGGIGHQEILAAENLKKIARTRLNIFSDTFVKLSKTLDTITEKQSRLKQKEINYIFEDISEKLCKNCSNCSRCWEQNFENTYQVTSTLFEQAEKNGFIHKQDIPVCFMEDCICAEEFITQTNRRFEIAKLNHIWHSRVAESREVIAEQLRDVASVIQDITGDIYATAEVSRSEEERVIRRLKSLQVSTRDITVFERGDRHKEIYLTASCRNGGCVTAKEAAAVIGEVIGLRIKVSEASKTVISKEYDNYIFVEDTKFKVLSGVARTMKESISGDNFSIISLESGEMIMAMSDGMGTGKEAAQESETVMSLLEQMMEAGFKPEIAIKLINSSLVLKSDRQTFSTIDMSIINLFTGMCECIKIGAASTFIKRDHWVETISSTTLPIGMFGSVDYDTVSKKLYEGDIVIMVTDGVLDSIAEEDKEAFMEQLIMEIDSNNPQEIANRILDRTMKQSNYVPKDDMTIIAAGIWLK